VGTDIHAAVEARDRRGELERFDEHGHAARRAAAGDGEKYPGLPQLRDRGDGPIGEDLVLGYQRAVDVGEEQPNWRGHVASSLVRWFGPVVRSPHDRPSPK